jgi:hypothetical protein
MNKTRQKIVRFAGHDCVVRAERYASSEHTALSLYEARSGVHVATATLNLPDIPLSKTQVFIKDYSENEGMLAALEQAGIIKPMGVLVSTGVGSLPVCELLIPPPEQEISQGQQKPTPDQLREEVSTARLKGRDIELDR